MGIKEWNNSIIEEFRANAGKVGGQFEGMPLLLLQTVGAKSGIQRTNPLAYLLDNGRYVIFASYAGAPNNPPWYFNLLANPEVSIEVGTERFDVRASVVEEPEKKSVLYQKISKLFPIFAEYQRKTTRQIPVIALSRR